MIPLVSPSEAVDRVVAVLGELPGTRWVGIDGKGASGKSSLADRIQSTLTNAVVVRADDFARPDVAGWEQDRFLRQVLFPLASGRPARYQRWDWATHTGAEWHDVPVGVPVIVEGVSSTDVRLGVPWDLTMWVEASYEVRLARVMSRDGPQWLDRWLTDWMPSEDAYEAEQRPRQRVDLIVDGERLPPQP
ncbi:MAG: hypothetical protein L0H24_03970 [Microlunatus sp.]|nr:hypothetical protein [Microlunatus sp.]